MIDIEQYDEWLEQLPDEDVEGFEDKVHEEGVKFAAEINDETCRNCLLGFTGDNPREWSEDAVESITTNCKTRKEAKKVVMTVVSRTLEALDL